MIKWHHHNFQKIHRTYFLKIWSGSAFHKNYILLDRPLVKMTTSCVHHMKIIIYHLVVCETADIYFLRCNLYNLRITTFFLNRETMKNSRLKKCAKKIPLSFFPSRLRSSCVLDLSRIGWWAPHEFLLLRKKDDATLLKNISYPE